MSRAVKSKTNEGGDQFTDTGNTLIDLFSKGGSAFVRRKDKGAFYPNGESALDLFKRAWASGRKKIALALAFWLRDCRGGAGNRSGFREIIAWLAGEDPNWLIANIGLVPQVGRWDDLRSLFGTNAELVASEMWIAGIGAKDHLACKWADRTDRPLYTMGRRLGLCTDIGSFRRWLADGRQTITERKMCAGSWREIEYGKVPSVCMARNTNAFREHDKRRFEAYKKALENGTEKINAKVLFPHDCVRTARGGDPRIANAQFAALPNYFEETGQRIMVLCDTSGSMSTEISGSIKAVDISQSLALYCSDRVGEKNPFYRKFIGFESESKFVDWTGMSFSAALGDSRIFDGACGGTRIDKALDHILQAGVRGKVRKDLMPSCLLIISDMQFHSGGVEPGTEVNKALKRWADAGYDKPQVVYWNVSPYSGSPEKSTTEGVALVSGFSPSILSSVLGDMDFNPITVMLKAIAKYDIQEPTGKETTGMVTVPRPRERTERKPVVKRKPVKDPLVGALKKRPRSW